jgi:hypothetical protein
MSFPASFVMPYQRRGDGFGFITGGKIFARVSATKSSNIILLNMQAVLRANEARGIALQKSVTQILFALTKN